MLVTLLYVTPALTQWSTNPNTNNAISTMAGGLNLPVILSDGSGGAFIAWTVYNGGNWNIYAQRVNASGVPQWTAGGVAICVDTGNQVGPTLVSDGSGGVIITWQDTRLGDADIYAQRVNASGTPQWTAGGVVIGSAANDQQSPVIVSDGSGGAIITWYDTRGADKDIYGQRVNASGTLLWGDAGGLAICTETGDQRLPTIVSDGLGGAIITWTDERNSGIDDIYAQRVNASGAAQWAAGGVSICMATNAQRNPGIVSDGSGGAIIAWADHRGSSDWDIYAQHVDASGSTQWATNGAAVCTSTGDQYYSTLVSDGSGGAIITWYDNRANPDTGDIYAQRVNTSGLPQWTANGVPICTATGDQRLPTIVSDGSGGAIITWYDLRNGNDDMYAQRVNASGSPQWATNGAAISTAPYDQNSPAIVSDGSGGAIITWSDLRNGSNSCIYAQEVDRFGYLGDARARIVKVKDVMNDQGGKVALMWNPSYLDVYPSTDIMSYAIYRGLKPSAANQSYAVLDADRYSKWENSASGKGKAYLRLPLSPTGTETIYWENVGTVNAEGLEGYSCNVTTLSDSGPQGVPLYYFMVRAKSYSSSMYWNSSPDSGYSVDNLPPISPQNPAILPLAAGPIRVHWNEDNADPDVGYYSIYRGTATGFPVNNSTRLRNTSDTTVTDATTEVGQQYYYRVTTVDIHGNESKPTAELHAGALAVQLASFSATTLTTGVQLEWTTLSETNSQGFYVERRPKNAGSYKTVSDLIPGAGTSLEEHHYQWTDTKVTDGAYNYRLKLVDLNGTYTYSNAIVVAVSGVLGVDDTKLLPTEFALGQNYPNPFNPTTDISYQLPVASHVKLTVYNMLGQEAATLVNGMQEAGYKSVEFDASKMPSGLYLYKLTAGTYTSVHKMVLIK